MSYIPMKTLTIDGQTYELVDANAVRFAAPQTLSTEQQAQARANMGINLFAYNFTTLSEEMVDNPQDAKAIDHIVQNWKNEPMSVYIQGYPVIGVDVNNHHLKVLYNDRYIYTFNWEVNGQLTQCRIWPHAVAKITYENEVKKYIDEQDASAVRYTPQSATPEQQAQARENMGVKNVLVVTIDGEDKASHSFREIYAHAQAGGTVVVKEDRYLYQLVYLAPESATFTCVDEDVYIYGCVINIEGVVSRIEIPLVSSVALDLKLDASKLPEAINAALARAKESGEFDGPKGDTGPAGPEGPAGETGPAGPQGPQGEAGPQGATGPKGDTGATGADGKAGADGKTPVKGTDYFTAADKAEMVNAVIAALPVYAGEVV